MGNIIFTEFYSFLAITYQYQLQVQRRKCWLDEAHWQTSKLI